MAAQQIILQISTNYNFFNNFMRQYANWLNHLFSATESFSYFESIQDGVLWILKDKTIAQRMLIELNEFANYLKREDFFSYPVISKKKRIFPDRKARIRCVNCNTKDFMKDLSDFLILMDPEMNFSELDANNFICEFTSYESLDNFKTLCNCLIKMDSIESENYFMLQNVA